MYRLTAHITALIAACVMLFGCSSTDVSEVDMPAPGPDAVVNLSFSVTVSDADPASRGALVTNPDDDNYFEPEATDYEKIHTLRVIILRNDIERGRIVEHNRLIDFDAPVITTGEQRFSVIGGEAKTVYLIANEASTGYDFTNMLQVGSSYTAGTLENLTIAPDAANGLLLFDNSAASATKSYIPMGESYEFFVPYPSQLTGGVYNAGKLFVTRAAVKFSFKITALYGDGLYLKNLMVNGLADKEYLLPHNTYYDPPKGTPGIANPSTIPNPGLAGHFITSYEIPSGTTHGSYVVYRETPIALGKEPQSITTGFYFCESKMGPTAPDGDPYTVSITLTDADGDDQLFPAVPLPNLPILPRNTHVKVNITLAHSDVTCEVEVVPYTGVWLDPDFGIDR